MPTNGAQTKLDAIRTKDLVQRLENRAIDRLTPVFLADRLVGDEMFVWHGKRFVVQIEFYATKPNKSQEQVTERLQTFFEKVDNQLLELKMEVANKASKRTSR